MVNFLAAWCYIYI